MSTMCDVEYNIGAWHLDTEIITTGLFNWYHSHDWVLSIYVNSNSRLALRFSSISYCAQKWGSLQVYIGKAMKFYCNIDNADSAEY